MAPQAQALSEVLKLSSMGELFSVISHLLISIEEAYGEKEAAEILLKAVKIARSDGKK